MGGKGSARSPDCHVERVIPGWKDIVQPYRDDAKFWSSVWQSAGRPSNGVLKDLMSRTRNQFQYAIRRVKKMSNSLRAKRLLEASEVDTVELLKEMKKVKGGNKGNHDLPDVVGGVSGKPQVVEEFRRVYSLLYNSSDTSVDLAKLKDIIENEISEESLADIDRVSGPAVKQAACRMKPSKPDISGSYTSDAILNAPDIFFDLLAKVYRS